MASFRFLLVIFLLSLTLLDEIESSPLGYPLRRRHGNCPKGYQADYKKRCRKIVYIKRLYGNRQKDWDLNESSEWPDERP